jgi:uncharacterized protein YrrD
MIPPGACIDSIVDFSEGKVLALLLKTGVLFNKARKVLRIQEIHGWDGRIQINSFNDIADSSDIVRLQDMLSSPRYSLYNLPVRTASGIKVGVVVDFTFDDISGTVMQYLVGRRRLFGENVVQSIIPRNEVIELTQSALIVRDSTASPCKIEEKVKTREEFTPEPA